MLNRVLPLCRPVLRQLTKNVAGNKPIVRASSHGAHYRVAPPPPSRATIVSAEIVGALMWWWVLWHLWHESEHITGEFPYPVPSSWTNSDLGIPPS